MVVLILIYIIIALLLIFFLTLPILSIIISLFIREKIYRLPADNPRFKAFDFGCIITAYKNAVIAKPLIQSLLQQPYVNFKIYLVADECDISEWDMFHEKLTVLRPDPPLRLKAKSIIHAIENFAHDHEYIAVFDADNLAHPSFLKEINQYANNDWRCIQGQRTAKNLDSVYACTDAIGEFYKNYIERYVPYLLGSSSVISGSGMAVEASLYKAYLASPEIEQGKHQWKRMLQEDKILQNFLLRRNEQICYTKAAIVFDEKVTTAQQVETQRSRWLFSYFQNLPNAIGILRRGLQHFSFNQLYFGILTIAPPLFILLFASLLMAVIGLWVKPVISLLLFLSIFLFGATIIWTLYLSKAPPPVWKALWALPLFVLKQITALFKMRNPDKNFKHTEHSRSYTIDEILNPKTTDGNTGK